MAKQRFSLDETMCDAVTNIEEAKTSPMKTISSTEVYTKTPEVNRVEEASNTRLQKLRKKIVKIEGNTNMRNVPLSDEMLDKFDSIKKDLNKNRNKTTKETFISIGDLLNIAAQEFLDKYYMN